MRLLDLCCGGGGAAVGYARIGFEVVGVDIDPQPAFPFEFHRADALEFPLEGFDVIHASPPCQRYSTLKTVLTGTYEPLIGAIRQRLVASGLPYVIENVPGARRQLVDPVMVCGTALGCVDDETELRRHRLFETSFPCEGTVCQHDRGRRPVGVYGHLAHTDRPNRPLDAPTGPHGWKAGRLRARALMGVDWECSDHDLGEAIPPVYAAFIGAQLLERLEASAVELEARG